MTESAAQLTTAFGSDRPCARTTDNLCRIFPVNRCRKAPGDALECDVVKRDNEMTPFDTPARDLSQLTNPRRIVNFERPIDVHATRVEWVTVHCINVRRAEIVSL